MKRIIGILIFSLVTTCILQAQNIETSTLEWNCSSIFEAQEGVYTSEGAKIVSSPVGITWYNNAGVTQKTFSISSFTGSWSNVSVNGEIVTNITYDDKSGVAHFSKSGNAIRIRIHLITETESPIYEFVVENINSL